MFKLLKCITVMIVLQSVIVSCSKSENENFDQLSEQVKKSLEYKELDWSELIPKSDSQDSDGMAQTENAIMKSFGFTQPENAVEELDGQYIKLPGFIVPLEIQGNTVTEFLLVPYFGACIHTPPPPKNQIVYVKTQGFNLEDTYLPVWVEGRLNVEDTYSEMGSSGYVLESAIVSLYDEF